MTTKQQQEALLYFKKHAEDWKNKALSADQRKVNVVQQRNGFVLHVIKNRAATKSTLDVGCGTGDLVCDIASIGVDSTGVDFASEMIDIARARAEQEKLVSRDTQIPALRGHPLSRRCTHSLMTVQV